MQRAVYALVAILSLFAANLRPTQAQGDNNDTNSDIVKPTGAPQNIDQHVDGAAPVVHADAPQGELTVPAGETLDNLVVRNRRVVLAGHINKDVLAINCDVVVKPGAEVGNYLNVIGGSVDNQAGDAVHVIRQNIGLTPGLAGVAEVQQQTSTDSQPMQRRDWPGSQVFMGLLGLLGGLVLFVTAPRATQRTSAIVALERGRALAIGVISAILIGFALLCGSVLLKSPLRVPAAPFVYGLAIFCAAVLIFGWLCGMAHVGELLQEKMGRRRSDTWYGQMGLGLLAFCLVNLVLGSIHPFLGGIGLFLESLFALMGLGAAIISGFGADSNWLSMRMRREASWFSRSTRL